MAKSKLVLAVSPTFDLTVGIPRAGVSATTPVVFTAKHRTRTQFEEWQKGLDIAATGVTVEIMKDMFSGWALEDAWTDENIEQLLENFAGSGLACYVTYCREIFDAKLPASVR